MTKPRLIIVIRHAQSEGNKNREIHQTIPDHRVKLTQDGWQQAYEAGRKLRAMLRADDTLHFFTSPYRRTRETTEGILATLTADDPEPSPFKRDGIKVYEEPRLREQDFGNFQPCSAEMERMWQERADYGHFFYRIPNGESAADAYDRVSGFNESLWRQFGEDDFASVCVLVTHGLMSRVFLMKWYHFSVEYFEDLRNVNHCEFLIMHKQGESGKYILENKLRTWSELRRERAAREKDEKETKGGGAKDETAITNGNGTANNKDSSKLDRTLVSPSSAVETPRRRWGGCPNGCNHDKSFRIRQALADLVMCDSVTCGDPVQDSTNHGHNGANGSLASRRPAARRFQSSQSTHIDHEDDDDDVPREEGSGIAIDVCKARDEVVSSPDGTPSFISVDDRLRGQLKSPRMAPFPLLHLGRDGGGTHTGHNSVVASDADSSEDDDTRRRMARLKLAGGTANGAANGNGSKVDPAPYHRHQRDQSGMGRGTKANRLGDAPHSSDGEHEADAEDEVAKAEKEDRSIEGSVY